MPFSDLQNSRMQVQQLMDIAITLADYTHSVELAVQIPAVLSRLLNLEPITLAVVRQSEAASIPEVSFIGSSGAVAGEAALQRHVVELFRQNRPGNKDVPALRLIGGSPAESGYSEANLADLGALSRTLVFGRPVDDERRMFLLIHRRSDDTALTAVQVEMLALLACELAKLLRCMTAWQDHPEILGSPFERLTDREWVVLRGLNSDDGEKQLADRLSLSPHTLHSHIKSIYRKIGVQGRLPLLLRLNVALRELRATTLSAPEEKTPSENGRRSGGARKVAYAV